MNKNDLNNSQNNNWLVVSKKTFVDRIKDFFCNIFRMLKIEKNIDETIPKEIPISVIKNEESEIVIQVKNKKQEGISERKKEKSDNSYYKMIYNGMNNGKYTIADLSPNEFLTVMKMQKVENEFILKKLKEAMDNYNT